jgi:outer membrane lipoprotein LolB
LLIMAGALSACATRESVSLPPMDDWATRQAVLSATDEWEFAGRIGVSAGTEGFNGKLWWRQDGVVFRARVSGPVGIGTVFINGDRTELTLTDRNGEVTELRNAEAELRQRYGWTIPVTSLRYWALGIPDPRDTADADIGPDGHLLHLQQRDWEITIDRYAEGGGETMPRRLTAIADDIRVRLIIDSWTFR